MTFLKEGAETRLFVLMRKLEYDLYYSKSPEPPDFGNMKFADLHIHIDKRDGEESPERIVDYAQERGLSAIAIAHYNSIRYGEKAKNYKLKHGYPIDVIIASELLSDDGHIVALGIQSDIKPGQSAEDTLLEIHIKGGVAVATHPGLAHTQSLPIQKIADNMENQDPKARFDAVDVFHATSAIIRQSVFGKLIFPQDNNNEARKFHERNKDHPHIGAAIGVSDAHVLQAVGTGATGYYEGDVISSIKKGETYVVYATNARVSGTALFASKYRSSGRLDTDIQRAKALPRRVSSIIGIR